MVVEWLCPGLRPTGSRRPRLLHCKVILLDEHELLQDVLYYNVNRSINTSLTIISRKMNTFEDQTCNWCFVTFDTNFYNYKLIIGFVLNNFERKMVVVGFKILPTTTNLRKIRNKCKV
ncbi:band 41-like protein 4 isoform X1 [Vespula squamosa]|uniref:Band 41-like protein 4 isoform X1 n=1 Tax=Vespula squamosa TaxID=30214 RepID=A0ABD2C1J9_VESSQ